MALVCLLMPSVFDVDGFDEFGEWQSMNRVVNTCPLTDFEV